MDIRYKNDANHNYMIIKKEKGPVNVNHEKMVIRNNIDGLLKMNLHFVDDEVFYYYDIRSKQSLGRLFEGRYISGEEMTGFFKGMVKAFNELEQYLLPVEGIIFDPEYIYVDIDSTVPEFAFYPPGKNSSKQEEILSLAEFLIDHTDRDDPLAGRLSYDYYESVTDGIISPAALLCDLPAPDKEKLSKREEDTPEEDVMRQEDNKEGSFDYWDTEEDMSELDYFLRNDPKEEKDKGLLKTALVCLGLIGAAAVFYLVFMLNPSLLPFTLPGERQYLAAGCIIALLFGAAVTGVIYIYNRHVSEKKEEGKKLKQEMIKRKAHNPDAGKEKLEYSEIPEVYPDDEKTTLLNISQGMRTVPYLAGNEMGDMICLPIDRCPYIVGKKGDKVNGVLKNSSVSRIHASIRETNGRYFLSDMNSTNGTFINGRRLELNETVALEDGDSVGFAGTVLVFRTKNSCQAC